ncbi:N-alpha-acetyltransferas-like protein 15 [Pseudovirgaria hyperparasitica]|uniref:N-alpha-acetyltransferas-like protein 15 n=1 Tax=Pseudovirgaria hyperparasitica TaxID=470096 RepID=A0A6A6WIJ3_9PEZI|nr:N-alpha-acetyltransferas-like protein 15 [Pseudovirgaria hyperparasitica]KAF2761836.1 N-alpha-acetyltransferas-like protein 15 [Pseudovirgaria hyperparasitica]
MSQSQQLPQLPPKESSLFRQVVKNYEAKQYKKGIKAADQILRKVPDHADTLAMKSLIINSQGKPDEAFALAKKALASKLDPKSEIRGMKSHICWHVYGLLHKHSKNYEEALKAFKFAHSLDPGNPNIMRDMSQLQVQIRDYQGYIQSRTEMLKQRASIRQNWTALALAHHLKGDLAEAEKVLTMYEDTLKSPPTKTDIEHSEAVLYKNSIIAEAGDVERALEHLDTIRKDNLDRTSVMELRAQYLLQLGRKEEAQIAYRALIKRNNEYRNYYEGLEKSLDLDRSNAEHKKQLKALYESFAQESERLDAARRIPLDFLQGEDFEAAVDAYLRRMLEKGVPSTFTNVKALYADPAKQATIQQLITKYAAEKETNGSGDAETNGESASGFQKAVLYFLAQHYDYHLSRDLNKATEYIEKALTLTPTSVDLNRTKARIIKHTGDTEAASRQMNHAREQDLRDRYINTKCAKYQLRNNENDSAIETMSKFTRNETAGGPLGDLHDMQCMWFLTEDAESFQRRGILNLALKRYKSLYDIFDVWSDDQYDFHTFSLRKGQIRAYVDMIRWEDNLRSHPMFTRMALSAVKIYLNLADNPKLSSGQVNGEDTAVEKKANRKAKKEKEAREKAEAEKKEAERKSGKKSTGADGESKKEDPDPEGKVLLATKTPLEDAMKFLAPVLEFSPKSVEGQNLGFEVFIRRRKYLLALKCLLAAAALDPESPVVHEQAIRLRYTLDALSEPLAIPVAEVIKSSFTLVPAQASLAAHNDSYLNENKQSVSHIRHGLKTRQFLDLKTLPQNEKDLMESIKLPSATVDDVVKGISVLKEWNSEQAVRKSFVDVAREKWPNVTAFKSA